MRRAPAGTPGVAEAIRPRGGVGPPWNRPRVRRPNAPAEPLLNPTAPHGPTGDSTRGDLAEGAGASQRTSADTGTGEGPDPALCGPAGGSVPLDLLRALRPHQWVKNLLLFVPLLLAHDVERAGRLGPVARAFAAFCLCASAGYVLNDLHDRAVDRRHPLKRTRPFAAGRLSSGAGMLLAAALLAAALGLSALTLPRAFTAMLAGYAAVTALYSAWLKRLLLLDVFTLAGLYTHRVLAGGAAGGVPVSEWLLAFCIFFFLGLAFAKRYAELLRVQSESGDALPGRAYRTEDLAVIEAVGPASGYLSVLVLALYVHSAKAGQLYRAPRLLWLLCPLLLYWVTRLWFLARRGQLNEDPVLFALKDPVSLIATALGLLTVLIAWLGVPG